MVSTTGSRQDLPTEAPRPVWGWAAVAHLHLRQMHLIPIMDMFAHAIDRDCMCGPVEDLGHPGLIAHNAFDGREDYEQGTRKRN